MTTSHAIWREREVLRRQHKSRSTENCYTFWLRRYMAALLEMPEGLSSGKKLEQFLTDLACHRDISASTQNPSLERRSLCIRGAKGGNDQRSAITRVFAP